MGEIERNHRMINPCGLKRHTTVSIYGEKGENRLDWLIQKNGTSIAASASSDYHSLATGITDKLNSRHWNKRYALRKRGLSERTIKRLCKRDALTIAAWKLHVEGYSWEKIAFQLKTTARLVGILLTVVKRRYGLPVRPRRSGSKGAYVDHG